MNYIKVFSIAFFLLISFSGNTTCLDYLKTFAKKYFSKGSKKSHVDNNYLKVMAEAVTKSGVDASEKN